MHAIKNQRWFALAAAFGFATAAAHAEIITPDSISNPPNAVGSANGTPVLTNNLVNTQYVGLGLGFNDGTAITRLNGVPVWAPAWPTNYGKPVSSGVSSGSSTWGNINYYAAWYGASLNSLTTRAEITVSSLTVETIGNLDFLKLYALGRNGLPMNLTPVLLSGSGPHGGELWRFTRSGIWGFSAILMPPPVVANANSTFNPAWGVAEVSFTEPAGQTPEPSSLVLAGLGALGLAARFGWRRTRGSIA